jgi:hypothetical protein
MRLTCGGRSRPFRISRSPCGRRLVQPLLGGSADLPNCFPDKEWNPHRNRTASWNHEWTDKVPNSKRFSRVFEERHELIEVLRIALQVVLRTAWAIEFQHREYCRGGLMFGCKDERRRGAVEKRVGRREGPVEYSGANRSVGTWPLRRISSAKCSPPCCLTLCK